jgi:hypothetical protein
MPLWLVGILRGWGLAGLYAVHLTAATAPCNDPPTGNAAIFLALGAKKVAAIVYLLGLSPRTIVVSDVDVAWLSDPSAMVMGRLRGLEDFAHADLIASSDCVSPEDDVRTPARDNNRIENSELQRHFST